MEKMNRTAPLIATLLAVTACGDLPYKKAETWQEAELALQSLPRMRSVFKDQAERFLAEGDDSVSVVDCTPAHKNTCTIKLRRDGTVLGVVHTEDDQYAWYIDPNSESYGKLETAEALITGPNHAVQLEIDTDNDTCTVNGFETRGYGGPLCSDTI